jgi:hypothetical protein
MFKTKLKPNDLLDRPIGDLNFTVQRVNRERPPRIRVRRKHEANVRLRLRRGKHDRRARFEARQRSRARWRGNSDLHWVFDAQQCEL